MEKQVKARSVRLKIEDTVRSQKLKSLSKWEDFRDRRQEQIIDFYKVKTCNQSKLDWLKLLQKYLIIKKYAK